MAARRRQRESDAAIAFFIFLVLAGLWLINWWSGLTSQQRTAAIFLCVLAIGGVISGIFIIVGRSRDQKKRVERQRELERQQEAQRQKRIAQEEEERRLQVVR